MVGCRWHGHQNSWLVAIKHRIISDDADPAPAPADRAAADRAAADPARPVLPPATASDDAPSPPAPPVDPSDMTTWNVLDNGSIPLPAQTYVADKFRASRTAHAELVLCFMSPEAEAAFLEQAQALFADLYQQPMTVDYVRRYPTVGCNAYTAKEFKHTTFSKVNLTTPNGPSAICQQRNVPGAPRPRPAPQHPLRRLLRRRRRERRRRCV